MPSTTELDKHREIAEACNAAGFTMRDIADRLGIALSTLHRKYEEWGLEGHGKGEFQVRFPNEDFISAAYNGRRYEDRSVGRSRGRIVRHGTHVPSQSSIA